ncbi:hypothetical protein [Cohaesibacter gelatinilyticus]|uniref:Uncharacterized protein n=1 Tax=Cohaesibacter gelatinilyticus TaxID=372072 RepID=A0A285PEG4_9HYPH|nr:hypothetical protein [Cohaesibacter gelatinilyticus]SNZ20105.1 hypothetical protein SAMN06265368_3204 [Cohaesibacter gelatinilyticus]
MTETNQPQFYLIFSSEIPSDLWLLDEDLDTGKKFQGTIKLGFEFELKPIGLKPSQEDVRVPEGTVFAGVLWGDGDHFEEYTENTWGILGEIVRIGAQDLVVFGQDGSEILSVESIDQEDGLPHVMPPEAFGLQRKPWWGDQFHWCKDGSE